MHADRCTVPHEKQKQSIKVRAVFLVLIALMIIVTFPACSAPVNPEPLTASEAQDMLSNPNAYKGRVVEKLPGVVFNVVSSSSGNYQYQCWADEGNSESFLIKSKEDLELTGDYRGESIFVTGTVVGEQTSQNAFGQPLKFACIEVTSIEKSDVSVFNLTQETLEVGQTLEQYGISVILTKIELAQKNVRVYFTVNNGTSDKISVYGFNSYIKIGSTQFDEESSYGETGALQTSVNAGIESTGYLVFKKIDGLDQPMTVVLDISSDDYMEVDRNLEPFSFIINE